MILSFFKKIISSELFKISSLNSINVFTKIGVGLITSKILAIYVGPSGMALIGNFRNFLASFDSISSLGFQNGIIKYVTENKESSYELKKIFSTLFLCIIGVSVFFGILLFCFADYWNSIVFDGYDFSYLFKILGFISPLYISSIYLNAIINGLGEFKKIMYINIIGNITGLLITIFFVLKYNVFGAVLSIIIAPSLLFFVSLYFLVSKLSLLKHISIKIFDLKLIKNLLHYFLMALVSGVLGPLVMLLIRNNLIENQGIDQAGYWEAMSRISSYYLLFMNTLLTVYYYPKLVSAQNSVETRDVLYDFYKKVLPIFGIGLILLFLLKDILISILFTEDFKPVSQLFFLQIIGDFLKTISWILALQFFAKKMTKAFIITEVFSLSILLVSSFCFTSLFEVEGVVLAHAFTYFIYTIVLGIYFRRCLFLR